MLPVVHATKLQRKRHQRRKRRRKIKRKNKRKRRRRKGGVEGVERVEGGKVNKAQCVESIGIVNL